MCSFIATGAAITGTQTQGSFLEFWPKISYWSQGMCMSSLFQIGIFVLQLKVNTYIHTYIHMHTSVHPSTHPPTHPSTHPPIHPSTHPPIHPSARMHTYTCACTHTHISILYMLYICENYFFTMNDFFFMDIKYLLLGITIFFIQSFQIGDWPHNEKEDTVLQG
jgi:hypothetical protein